jgi:hypothetical protein
MLHSKQTYFLMWMSWNKFHKKQNQCSNITSVCNPGLNLWVAKLKYVFETNKVLLRHLSRGGGGIVFKAKVISSPS